MRCPMSGKPLKLKDLMDIHFTEIKDGDNRALIAKQVITPYDVNEVACILFSFVSGRNAQITFHCVKGVLQNIYILLC